MNWTKLTEEQPPQDGTLFNAWGTLQGDPEQKRALVQYKDFKYQTVVGTPQTFYPTRWCPVMVFSEPVNHTKLSG